MKKIGIISFVIWLLIGIYGVFFNITWIDEAKYLIKGWLMTTKQVGYYSTKGFFYQHMPGGLLWYGLGQKLFGPSLLVARIQSWILGIGIFSLCYLTAKRLFGKKAGVIAIALLSLSPVLALYYSSAVASSISALMLMLAFWSLSGNKRYLASLWFSLLLVARENFIFSLGIYILWLIWFYRKEFYKHLLIILSAVGVFVVPGLPDILNVFKNFPGINLLMPISQIEKQVLTIWLLKTHNLSLYLKAVKEFGAIYFIWLLVLIVIIILRGKLKINKKQKPIWLLMQIMFWFNLLAHTIVAFQLTPRSIIVYFAYVAPVGSLLASNYLVRIKDKKLVTNYGLLLLSLPITIMISSIFSKHNTIKQLEISKNNLSEIIENKNKIIWLTEPMSLYLANKVSYYPLINHTNVYKTNVQTEAVKRLGFWNQEMMSNWLDEAEMVVVGLNKLKLMNRLETTATFVKWFDEELMNNWKEVVIEEYIWPEGLKFYLKG